MPAFVRPAASTDFEPMPDLPVQYPWVVEWPDGTQYHYTDRSSADWAAERYPSAPPAPGTQAGVREVVVPKRMLLDPSLYPNHKAWVLYDKETGETLTFGYFDTQAEAEKAAGEVGYPPFPPHSPSHRDACPGCSVPGGAVPT